MKRISKILPVLFICALIFSSNVFASTRTTLYLSSGVWTAKGYETRTGNYSSTYARTYAVYPPNGAFDTYTKVKVRVESTARAAMSDEITLYETASSNTTIQLREGTLSNKNIYFFFRGNDPDLSAYADVFYDAR